MNAARRACVLILIAGVVPAAQAGDTQAAAKPAAGASPATTTPAKNAATGKAGAAKPVPATKPPPPPADDELLEFLGSVDSDTGDQDWIDYLSQTDIAKVAKGK